MKLTMSGRPSEIAEAMALIARQEGGAIHRGDEITAQGLSQTSILEEVRAEINALPEAHGTRLATDGRIITSRVYKGRASEAGGEAVEQVQ